MSFHVFASSKITSSVFLLLREKENISTIALRGCSGERSCQCQGENPEDEPRQEDWAGGMEVGAREKRKRDPHLETHCRGRFENGSEGMNE